MAEKLALVVDDSRVARMTLTRLLKTNGFQVNEHDSAESALKWLTGDVVLPDIIFMDVMMSGMDGVSATRELKLRPLLKNIPVVVCTGQESNADVDKARLSGATAVLSKPPSLSELNDVLSHIASPAPTETVAAGKEQFDSSLMSRVQTRLEQHWLPEVLATFQRTIEQDSQQISDKKLQQIHQHLMPELQQSIANNIELHFNRALDEQKIQLQQEAKQALEITFKEFNLDGRLAEFEALKASSSDWFDQQKHRLESKYVHQLEHELAERIELILEEQLRPKLLAMINAQLTEENAALFELRDLQLQQAHQASRIQWLALGSFILAGLALILVLYSG